MHERYEDQMITEVWSDPGKLMRWEEVELAVIQALENLEMAPLGICAKIRSDLEEHPIDLEWWKERDNQVHHDLNAFLDERRRHIAPELQQYWHKDITSYDTEEPSFVKALQLSYMRVIMLTEALLQTLHQMAEKYCNLPMMARTHGQEAQLQSFGKRCLSWHKEMQIAMQELTKAGGNLGYSKLSGAIGNYGGIDPRVEKAALRLLALTPFHGATQIMPRIIYQPLANALCGIVCVGNKIALDVRLGARSGRPLCHEPFGKKQMGSSAMPHKKNTILTEQMEGMESMVKGYLLMITDRIKTWEERAIEQSCVERVAWPDLFHVTIRCLNVMNKVLSGLVVYPDNMMLEIIESCGCYASNAAKEFLKERALTVGLTVEEAYRIVQLAAFNAFQPNSMAQGIREHWSEELGNYGQAEECMNRLAATDWRRRTSIKEIIALGNLKIAPELEASQDDVNRWNTALGCLFSNSEIKYEWEKLFTLRYHLKHEHVLFGAVLYGTD